MDIQKQFFSHHMVDSGNILAKTTYRPSNQVTSVIVHCFVYNVYIIL